MHSEREECGYALSAPSTSEVMSQSELTTAPAPKRDAPPIYELVAHSEKNVNQSFR